MKSKILATGALAATTAVAVVAPGVSVGRPRAPMPRCASSRGLSSPRAARSAPSGFATASAGRVRIRVTRNTAYERIDGFSGLKVGARNIEATVRRSDGRWIAVEVERSGGGGEHGGDDD